MGGMSKRRDIAGCFLFGTLQGRKLLHHVLPSRTSRFWLYLPKSRPNPSKSAFMRAVIMRIVPDNMFCVESSGVCIGGGEYSSRVSRFFRGQHAGRREF